MNIKKTTHVSCPRVRFILTGFGGTAPDREIPGEVREHIEHCPECREELYTMQQLTLRVRELPEVDVPPNFSAVVMSTINTRKSPVWGWIKAPALVYSFVFILFLSLGLVMSQSMGITGNSSTKAINSPSPINFTVAQVFKDSQDVRLISIQENSMSLLYGNNAPGEPNE